MPDFDNPFRPGAGHRPPYLAGRKADREEFRRLLSQSPILENMVLTGLRGVGKTVLLESLKPLAIAEGWSWADADLSESASISENSIAVRLCTDLTSITSDIVITSEELQRIGFTAGTETMERTLDFQALQAIYENTPGLMSDKLKNLLESVWRMISSERKTKGIIFAYDEVQNLSNQPDRDEFPLSLLLNVFQSLQKKGLPLMLVLAGLPTLFPKLVEARTFSERMFRVVFLNSLDERDSTDAIVKPLRDANRPDAFTGDMVREIVEMSGGYPYFIQFICREMYDAVLQKNSGARATPGLFNAIEQKLDTDFFAGRWARTTDRQRELLFMIAQLENCDDEFTIQEIVGQAKTRLDKPFSSSHVNQMLGTLAGQGLVFKNRHGKYSFAIPLLGQFIKRRANDRDA